MSIAEQSIVRCVYRYRVCDRGVYSGRLSRVMALRRALHFVFKVGDRTRTATFYRDVLGMKVEELSTDLIVIFQFCLLNALRTFPPNNADKTVNDVIEKCSFDTSHIFHLSMFSIKFQIYKQ